MKNIFNEQDANEFISRINKLTPASQAQWGKMNVSQMLAHCQAPLKIGSGELKIKVNPIIKFLFGKSARKELTSANEGFKKSLPTFKEAIIVDEREFEKEKTNLISRIQDFHTKGEAGLIKEPHPFFGDLSVAEWNALQTKHLDHHLKQFGV